MTIDTQNLKKIVLRHIDLHKMNLYQFARKNGIPQPTLYRFLKEENATPNIKTINKILAGLDPWEIGTNNILNIEK
jgi:predicted transcriptional regulator